MGLLDGINKAVGNRVSGQLSAPKTAKSTKAETVEQKPLLSFQGNNSIGRKDLDKINPYFSVQGMSAESKKIVDDTNKMMEQLGFKNYKVNGTQVESITKEFNATTQIGMDNAKFNAEVARLTGKYGSPETSEHAKVAMNDFEELAQKSYMA